MGLTIMIMWEASTYLGTYTADEYLYAPYVLSTETSLLGPVYLPRAVGSEFTVQIGLVISLNPDPWKCMVPSAFLLNEPSASRWHVGSLRLYLLRPLFTSM